MEHSFIVGVRKHQHRIKNTQADGMNCICIITFKFGHYSLLLRLRLSGRRYTRQQSKQQATKWIDRVKNLFKCFLATRCFCVLKAVIPSHLLLKVAHYIAADVTGQKASARERFSNWPYGNIQQRFVLSVMLVLNSLMSGEWMSL